MDRPIFLRTRLIASIGAIVNHSGASAAPADATMRQSGCSPSDLAWSSAITTTAAAPSLHEGELPTVRMPFSWNAGLSVRILPNSALFGSSSSTTTTAAPFRCGTSTGAISRLKAPDAIASFARR